VSDIPSLLDHTIAGRYVLTREIGRGGAATVYLAHDVRHERLVAVKVLHPELSHALGARRFLREIRLTASLQHPHILPIHDSGAIDEQLYYVMPFMDGESLRERLAAQGRLSIAEMSHIGGEVAGALAYAHARGVVHRDIKPENILFSDGHAVVADFGIARAIDRATDAITQAGTITGTPAYMSPEQARDRAFDGRSDVYSLACVLYEALAGLPPYVGDSPQQLLAQRVAKTAPRLRAYRHDVPAAVDSVIATALSIDPDDRFDGAEAFGVALAAAVGDAVEAPATRRRRRPAARRARRWAAGATLLVAGVAASTPRGRDQLERITAQVEPARYAVVPFQYVGGRAPPRDADPAASGMYDALRRWEGLDVVSEVAVTDALRSESDGSLSLRSVARIARRVHAGRVVWGRVRVTADSVIVRAGLYDASSGQRMREVSAVLRAGRSAALASIDYGALAARLLRDSAAVSLSASAERGTSSFAAWQAFERGSTALARWQLVAAGTALTQATAADPSYPQANLWLAQLRFLEDSAPAVWTPALRVAARARTQLDPREQLLADALGAMARDDQPAACREYDALRATDSLDVMAWLGLTFCRSRDRTVVASSDSPTGVAFRGSAETAWRAASRALEIMPDAFTVLGYEQLRRLTPVEYGLVRVGHRGATPYGSGPSLMADTLAFAPGPVHRLAPAGAPPAVDAALHRDRERLLSLLTRLAARLPDSPDVFEALTGLLESRDELVSAPDGRMPAQAALARARRLASAPEQRLRLAVAVARSASIADSVLSAMAHPTPREAYWLSGLAAFGGRAALAAHYDRLGADAEVHRSTRPLPEAADALAALELRAGSGVCDDSLGVAVRTIDGMLASYVGATERSGRRDRSLERALVLAAPCDVGRAVRTIHTPEMPVTRLAQRLGRGDARGVRLALDSIDRARGAMAPGAISLDIVVLEAWLRDASGDAAGAARRLDLPLGALPTLSPLVLTEPVAAASVGRAMAYRADLAHRLGDHATAARWANRVLVLWRHPDPALAPTVVRMRGLATSRDDVRLGSVAP
jgi:tRNA A-37 threonylcarbamoyl transferase component Bud32/TolB-like protein